VGKKWYSTLKLLQGVPGYQSSVPVDPSFIVVNVPDSALRANSKMVD
jgi:hypothetical protein